MRVKGLRGKFHSVLVKQGKMRRGKGVGVKPRTVTVFRVWVK